MGGIPGHAEAVEMKHGIASRSRVCFSKRRLRGPAVAASIGDGGRTHKMEHRPLQRHRWGPRIMVERRIELNRRYRRKHKMTKLKAKLAAAKDGRERETILRKIHLLSPEWSEPVEAK